MSPSWWYLSRASGVVAWSLLAASVLWGLLLSTRVFDRKPSPKWLTDLHRFLGGLAVVFVGCHVGSIVADSYVHFGAADVLVPLATKWHPVAVAWGIVVMWLMLAVEVTSLAMRHLPRRLWHAVHLSSYGLFVSATVHAFAAGPDTRHEVFELVCVAVVTILSFLTLVRISKDREEDTRARDPSASRSRSRGRARLIDGSCVERSDVELVVAVDAGRRDDDDEHVQLGVGGRPRRSATPGGTMIMSPLAIGTVSSSRSISPTPSVT